MSMHVGITITAFYAGKQSASMTWVGFVETSYDGKAFAEAHENAVKRYRAKYRGEVDNFAVTWFHIFSY